MRRRFLTAALAFSAAGLLSGCPPPRCPRVVERVGVSLGAAADGTLFVEGAPVSFTMAVPIDGCTHEPAERIAVEVTGPRNEAITPTIVAEGARFDREVPENTAREIEIGFTPPRAGWHRVETTFEYGYGVSLGEVLVSERRPAEVVLELERVAQESCETVVQTPSGAILCGGRVFRDGVQVQEVAAIRAAVAGNNVWTVSASGLLQLFEDTASGELTLVDSEPTLLADATLFALGDDVVLVTDNRTRAYRREGAAVTPIGDQVLDAAPAAAVRNGDTLFVAYNGKSPTTSELEVRVCPHSVPGMLAPGTCTELQGRVVGAEPDAFWIDSGAATSSGVQTSHTLRLARVASGRVTSTTGVFGLPNLWEPSTPKFPTTPAVLYPAAGQALLPVLPRETPEGDVLLQVYDTPLSDVRATAAFVWGVRSNRIVVLRR